MSSHYGAVRGRCFRALAPALAGLCVFVTGVASNASVMPQTPQQINPPDPAPVPPVVPPAPPPPPAFAFASPLPGREIGSPFGLRRLPWEPTGRLHEGVDMAAPGGETVHVTCAGTVAKAGISPSYGRYVEVRHADGVSSFYAHLGRWAKGVKPGVALAAGDPVGAVGDSGHSTGAHLHFELRKDGRPLNPQLFIGRAFATLTDLPLTAARAVPRHVRLASVSRSPGWTSAPRTFASVTTSRGKGRRAHAVLAAAD